MLLLTFNVIGRTELSITLQLPPEPEILQLTNSALKPIKVQSMQVFELSIDLENHVASGRRGDSSSRVSQV